MTRHLLVFAAGLSVGLAVRAARLHGIDQCGCLVGTEQRSNRLHETRDRLDQINGDLAQVNDVLTAHVAAGDARIAALRAELSTQGGEGGENLRDVGGSIEHGASPSSSGETSKVGALGSALDPGAPVGGAR